MPSSAWDDCCPPPQQRSRLLDRLRLADRIDVKFLGPFNPHLVAKDAVNHCRRWMISDFRPIPVVSVCLFPYSSIFQTNDGPAGQPLKGAIHATYKQIHLSVGLCGSFRCSFLFSGLFSNLAVDLEPGIESLDLVCRELIQACSLEFLRGHHFLDAARHLRWRCSCRFDTGQHHAKSKVYAPEYSTAANLHDIEIGNRDSRMLAPGRIAS